MVLICPSEPSRERVKVSHLIVECRVINYHPKNTLKITKMVALTSALFCVRVRAPSFLSSKYKIAYTRNVSG